MPRTRLIVATLVVGLVAVACGGDTEPSDSGAQTGLSVDTAAAPVADAGGGAVEAPAVAELSAVESVRLGARFGWCTDVQGAWDSTADALSATIAVVAAYYEALLTADTATDDLDRAEAAERAAALEQLVDDALDRYTAVIAAATGQPRTAATGLLQMVEGVATADAGGTQAVAYQRAREAHAAAASEADMTLLREFFGIQRYWKLEADERAAQLGLPLPAAVHATLKVRELLYPPRRTAAQEQNVAEWVGDAVVAMVAGTEYPEAVQEAVHFTTLVPSYAHLLSIDIGPAADAYAAEAAVYETVIGEAVDAALEAFAAAYDSATATGGSLDEDALWAARVQAGEAAGVAARAIFKDAVERLGDARVVAVAASDEAIAAVSAEDRDLINAEMRFYGGGALNAGWAAYGAVRDAAGAASGALYEAQEAAAESARRAHLEALPRALPEAVTETAAAARAEGLASAVIADLMLYQLGAGMFDPGDMYSLPSFTPNGLWSFLTSAVAAETLIRSQAWRALQQSLADDCQ